VINVTNLPPLFDIHRILPLIQAGSLILTPNNRLRSKILQAWGDYQQAQAISVWETPRILVIEQWLSAQWEQLQAHGHPDSAQNILSSEQQRIIWESITADCGLMQVDAVAKQAANAFTTLVRWNQSVTPHSIDKDINPQFSEWIKRFQQRLSHLHYITAEDSYRIIGNAFDKQQLKQEPRIYLLGFDDLSPLLQEQLDKACDQLDLLPHSSYAPQTLQRVECENSQLEMQTAAQWARECIKQQPLCRVGIIVPNLGQCRQQVEQAFSAEFEAHSLSPNTERYTLPFNFSAGTPLGDTPLIAATLQLLKLQEQRGRHQEWDVEFLTHCLLSPFWGRYTPEVQRRSALVNKLQSLGTFTISGDTLRYWAEKIDAKGYRIKSGMTGNGPDMTDDDNTPSFRRTPESTTKQQGLFDYLNQFHQFSTHNTNKGKHLPSRWVEVFLQQLAILQWPGERTPDSQEYQQTQLWYQLLETFASLDSVLNAIDSNTALQQLQRMANQLPFQAKVPDSPIQILGVLEGAGLHFTHCWVMGLHQKAWPPAPSPNSLLPIRLQRDHNMPHASSLRELAYAQSLTENYRHCADTIIFSSPTHEDDSEQPLLVSQLIRNIPLIDISVIDGNTQATDDALENWYQQLQQNQSLDIIDCATAPAFTHNALPGGSGLFKAQAENPFDSFVKYRLGAPLPIAPVNGFSHIEKGNILHNSLAALWQQLNSQENLLALSDDALAQLISEQVNIAISDVKRHKPKHLSDTLCQIESERQSQLLAQWFDVEKQRPPFTVVAMEEARTIHVNGMNINIRIDRVDQLPDGRYLIIDYKTGQANINAWKSQRPKEPQMPLYAVTYSENIHKVKGISFAQININDQTFKGIGDGDIATGITHIEKNKMGLPSTWESTLEHWQQIVDQLLTEFTQGDCAIEYLDETSKTYARDYLRINRFYEKESLQRIVDNSQ
jgi:ATP-dependent helicase/nuclease subunit B